ncbi:hypothetical protein [Salinicoccus halodurans]|uniref:Uncharacterized protein n=1 Tax=Salinicoccus halodurans TaxID=407035 RepID=A0A0F7HMY2_9STAP|nr:hypothetical protein [Salinicoccus halodurans]AKG74388.1 hypothetical protein AAT16_09160 [Salinicoccus halodurans]SFK95282.1 hypothetical protein SAMN05216235_2730 [Salinicoccus halodurans]
MTLFTGLLHRKHLYKDGERFATMIPGAETVSITQHMYHMVMNQKRMTMTYTDYEQWLKDNNYEERETG